MIVVNTSQITGMKIIETKGLVGGHGVLNVNDLFSDVPKFTLNPFKAYSSLKQVEKRLDSQDYLDERAKIYRKSKADARKEALSELIREAKEIGANAVINVKMSFENNEYPRPHTFTVTEILAYGTAVIIEPIS